MKVFAFFLAILVLGQSMLPCSDSDLAARHVKAKTEMTKALHSHESPGLDDCSPFCQCACCAVFSVNHSTVSVNLVPVYNNTLQAGWIPSYALDMALPVWQPPQLS